MRIVSLVVLVLSSWLVTPVDGQDLPSPSGSLLVRVFSGADDLPIEKATVEVVDLESVTPAPGGPPPKPQILGRASTDARGWAAVENLPAGRVVLRILPAGRKYPHVTDAVAIAPGERTLLDDVVVPPPSELVVHFDVSDSLLHHLREGLFKLKVFASVPAAPGRAPITLEATEPTATFADFPPGKWRLFTAIALDKPFIADKNPVEVEVPAGTRIDVTVPVPGLLFAGTLRHRGEPFPAHMNLQPVKMTPDDFGFAASTDAEGRFAIPLRRAGSWSLMVRPRDSRRKNFGAVIPAVEFREADARREMVIDLPEGSVAGRVVDSEGNGLRATVAALLEEQEEGRSTRALTATEDDGEFILDLLVAGKWKLEPTSQTLAGDPVTVTVETDAETGGVTLVLSRKKRLIRISGQNENALRGLYARVSSFRPGSPRPDETVAPVTGGGVASVDLAGSDGAPAAIAIGERGVVSAFIRPLAEEMRVTLEAPTATLVFDSSVRLDDRFVVHEDGSFFKLSDWVSSRKAGSDAPLAVRVRPGMWQLVFADSRETQERLYAGLGWSLAHQVRVHVAAGAVVDLR